MVCDLTGFSGNIYNLYLVLRGLTTLSGLGQERLRVMHGVDRLFLYLKAYNDFGAGDVMDFRRAFEDF